MITFGLTGGIASGKSTVARLFSEFGVPVIDADQMARRAVAVGSEALSAIAARFGSDVLDAQGQLDRAALGRLVFGHPARLAELNAIVHPEVARLVDRERTHLAALGHELACYDIPLLFETNQQHRYRPVVVVTAADEMRIARMMLRDGLDRAAAEARLASQMPLSEKVRGADVVIENNDDLAHLRIEARRALDEVYRRTGLGKTSD